MQCLLLTLGAALVCGVRAIDIPQTMQDVELPKLAGTWHSMAMAASDFSLLETKEAPLRIYISSLQPTPEGNLEIALRKRSQNQSPFRESNQYANGLEAPGGRGAKHKRVFTGGTRDTAALQELPAWRAVGSALCTCLPPSEQSSPCGYRWA
ncbi:glycodelin-like [Nomascus leucogenys]|uniref:glycodelin-like n=1 Tax=Nomascus leucogenys TaxID=61853 RepID=UPI00122D7D4A|nr:glycodelin-like [Nomascus leucogenys]